MKKLSTVYRLLSLTVLLLMLSWTTILHAEIINGGFETGNLSGWQSYHSYYQAGDPYVCLNDVGYSSTEGQYFANASLLALEATEWSFGPYSSFEQTFEAEAGQKITFKKRKNNF